MISIQIDDIKTMMSRLLTTDEFDSLLVTEITLQTGTTYNFSGKINKGFYSNDELEALPDQSYAQWASFRNTCFNLIKGTKTPTFFKIILKLPQDKVNDLIVSNNLAFRVEDIEGLFMNLTYQNNEFTCITGVSNKIFTLDKELDNVFDKFVSTLFS